MFSLFRVLLFLFGTFTNSDLCPKRSEQFPFVRDMKKKTQICIISQPVSQTLFAVEEMVTFQLARIEFVEGRKSQHKKTIDDWPPATAPENYAKYVEFEIFTRSSDSFSIRANWKISISILRSIEVYKMIYKSLFLSFIFWTANLSDHLRWKTNYFKMATPFLCR